jgi:NTP pyrophosphatase (non-canonical NTP hydrolase)
MGEHEGMDMSQKIPEMQKMQEAHKAFVKERGLERFHNPKSLSMALSVEAAELLEIFQWLTDEQALNVRSNPERFQCVKEEIADVFIYLLRLADDLKIDLEAAFWEKMEKNAKKYPPEKGRELACKIQEP